ncbi:hypothetical protein DPMN_043842 [Dreissena polymorpha]|uniref:Uncharacterized protein n=1 Tax=Dreissena polymorpha TaxID=45954 RepID=A0A9D4HY80_DREPO|nr:hypothetical protein DPMN_043842 [Dreissena polymorpha]
MKFDANGKPKLSEEEINIHQAFHAMNLKPWKKEKPEDLMWRMGEQYHKDATETAQLEATTATTTAAPDVTTIKDLGSIPKTGNHHFPKLPTFYGEDIKKDEVSWTSFKFELLLLLEGRCVQQETDTIRKKKSCKG